MWCFPLGTHRKQRENERQSREAQGGGSGGMLSEKIFIFRASEIPFPMLFRGNFHESKPEKSQLFSNLVVYTLWQTLVQLILVTMWIQAKGET